MPPLSHGLGLHPSLVEMRKSWIRGENSDQIIAWRTRENASLTCNLTLKTRVSIWASAADGLSNNDADTLVLTVRAATELFRCVSSTTLVGDVLLCGSFQSIEISNDGGVIVIRLSSVNTDRHLWSSMSIDRSISCREKNETYQRDLWCCCNLWLILWPHTSSIRERKRCPWRKWTTRVNYGNNEWIVDSWNDRRPSRGIVVLKNDGERTLFDLTNSRFVLGSAKLPCRARATTKTSRIRRMIRIDWLTFVFFRWSIHRVQTETRCYSSKWWGWWGRWRWWWDSLLSVSI